MEVDTEALAARLRQGAAGFTHIEDEANQIVPGLDDPAALGLARAFSGSPVYQDRMFAVLVLGAISARDPTAYEFLRDTVAGDGDWRVQEMLARAFDQRCRDTGYEASLPTIREWLAAPHPNQRRAVSEGLRIWTSRPYFKAHPDEAIRLLAALRDDDSEYVRKSAGNALRDVSRKFPELVREELASWDLADPRVRFTRALAARFL